MSGGFPLGLEICNGTSVGANTGSTLGTSCSGGGANTVGSWVQLTASSAIDAVAMIVSVFGSAASSTVVAFDIGVGAGGSEVVIAQQLVTGGNTVNGNTSYFIPCAIPSGTRIAARMQGTANDSATVCLSLFDGAFTNFEGYAGVDSIGFVAASTHGTVLTGGAANTKGSFAQLVASTGKDYAGLILNFDNIAGTSSAVFFLVDIAIGAAASEQVIIPNLGVTGGNTANANCGVQAPIWIPIPAGTRISARCQNAAGTGTIGLTLYGVYQ